MNQTRSKFSELAAPSENGAALQFPSLSQSQKVLSANIESTRAFPADFAKLRQNAKSEIANLAYEYTSQYSNAAKPSDGDSIILSGHQPELFHPGVWYKNFSLDSLAKKHLGTGINLVIDSELYRKSTLNVPTGSIEKPIATLVPFDNAPIGSTTFETSQLLNPNCIESFPRRLGETIKPLGLKDPLIENIRQFQTQLDTNLVGQLMAQSRHLLEQNWGVLNLELPLSHVCNTRSFAEFCGKVLAELPNFVQSYNGALSSYRTRNRLRSKTHPAPDLIQTGNLVETPFWFWSNDDPTRKPLMVRWSKDKIEIEFDGKNRTCSHDRIADLVCELNQGPFAIRSRALMTTLYARTFLSDLFIHGIGGAKYDEVTDMIIKDFFGIDPLQYYCLSATVRLPFNGSMSGTTDEVRPSKEILRLQRDLQFNPERQLNSSHPQVSELSAAKQQLLREIPERGKKKSWHRKLTGINRSLYAFSADQAEYLGVELDRAIESERRQSLLMSREFSFAIFNEQTLRPLMEQIV